MPRTFRDSVKNHVCALLAVGLGFTLLSGCATEFSDSDKAATQPFETPAFRLTLQTSSQTLVSLAPKSAEAGFDFAPSNRFAKRLGDGNYRLGDIDLRLRKAGTESWQDYSSAYRRVPVLPLKADAGDLAAADITATLASSQTDGNFPLKVVRRWRVANGKLTLTFMLENVSGETVEIGGLGLPMIFDNIVSGRTLDEAHEHASFYDPYVGRDGGYLQVTRLNGKGPALLVVPEKNTPFELYKPILDQRDASGKPKIYNDPEPHNATFEGFYDWMVASKGFADTDWKGIRQWNRPSSLMLRPGERRAIGVAFVLSPTIRQIEPTLIANDRPVAVGIPGYVVPTDLPAKLFLHTPHAVKTIDVFPKGALRVSAPADLKDGWQAYTVTGVTHGRARLRLTYADGEIQTVHYLVTQPETQAVAAMGHFLTTKQWYENPSDPFHRSPSIMGYDREAGHIITQDRRVWIAGLSDEGGAGSWLATIMKELNNPVPEEVAKFERFANETLWGQIQVSAGPDTYGVHKSIFYYDPKHMPPGTYDPKINWKTWEAWDKKGAADLGRSYNYPHVAAAWWTLYRLARYHTGLTHHENWQTYLTRAAETTKAMMTKAPYYTQFGLMEGDVFVYILQDLKAEGMTAEAQTIETMMKGRADHWNTLKYPFGSEMPWDSTGQAEVYMWMRYFGDQDKADITREVILGYDPTIPHWGYNGSARRFWDFLYAGKFSRIERQLHHYGSSLNAVALFDAYRANPADLHLLRVAYGGLMGSLTNIDEAGFAGSAFHSFPDAMHFDAMNGDYGMSFYGHAVSTASYLVRHPVFGWIGFGGRVAETDGTVTLTPKDSGRVRSFVAPAGLWLQLAAGKIESLAFEPASGKVTLTLAPRDAHTPEAFLDLAVTTKTGTKYRLATAAQSRHGGYAIKLTDAPTKVVLVPETKK